MATTDSIRFTCTSCGHTATFPRAQEGKAIYCPQCQAAQVVKGGTDRFEAERIATGRIAKAEAAPSTDRIARQPFGTPARIDFVCGACNHTSRISSTLSGQPVRCPTCGTVQLAGIAGLRVVRLDQSGKLPFTCSACGYQARLNADYGGKAIRCPKCQGAQVVPRVLRDPSGTHQALPSGAAIVRKEPGTGSIRRDGTGSIRKDGGPAALRSEPSPALRTPAGGIQVAQPLSTPTPLPGTLTPPPPISTRTPLPMAAPEPSASGPLSLMPASAPAAQPTPPPAAVAVPATPPPVAMPRTPPPSARPMPASAPSGGDDDLDLSDGAGAKPKGGVVRRSGRMRTPLPESPAEPPPVPPEVEPGMGAEPTLEPARAVDPEPDEPVAAAKPAPAAPRARATAPVPAGKNLLVPVLGVVAVVLLLTTVVFAVMMSSANTSAANTSQELERVRKAARQTTDDLEAEKRHGLEIEAARKLMEKDRDAVKADLDAAKRELETLRAENGRLKAEAAARPPAPSPAADPKPGAK